MDMTYLLIIFVIALALAPLSHFVPSKRQREIARLREYAAVELEQAGLAIEEQLVGRPDDRRRRVRGVRPRRVAGGGGSGDILHGADSPGPGSEWNPPVGRSLPGVRAALGAVVAGPAAGRRCPS